MSLLNYRLLGITCNPFEDAVFAERFYFADENMYTAICDNVIVVGSEYKTILNNIAGSLVEGAAGVSILTGKFGSGKTSAALGAYCEAKIRMGSERRSPLLIYIQAGTLPTDKLPNETIVDVVTLLSLAVAARALCVLKLKDPQAHSTLIKRLLGTSMHEPLKVLVRHLTTRECSLNNEHEAIVNAYKALKFKPKTKCEEVRHQLMEIVKSARNILIEVNRYAGAPLYVVIDQFENLVRELGLLAGEGVQRGGLRTCLELRDFMQNFVKLTMHTPKTSIYFALLVLTGYEYELIKGDTSLQSGIFLYRLDGFKSKEEVKELIDKFFTARFLVGGSYKGPCYAGDGAPSQRLFTNEAIERLRRLRYPRSIILVLKNAIEEAAGKGLKPPIDADVIDKIMNRVIKGFDPEVCMHPSIDARKIDQKYPRLLLKNIIDSAINLQFSSESPIKVEVEDIVSSNYENIGAILKIYKGKNGSVNIAVIAGRKRVDKRVFNKVLGINESTKTTIVPKIDLILALSVDGIAKSTLEYLRRLKLAFKIKDVSVGMIAKRAAAGDAEAMSLFRALGCLENAEDPENVIRALLFIAEIRMGKTDTQ